MSIGRSGAGARDPESELWDVVVIGSGAGGATAGFALARAGRSVLFLERGKLLHQDPSVTRGQPFSWTGDAEAALRHGWWPDCVYRRDGEREVAEHLPLGCGSGGSTALFAMVMDRFRPQDFEPRRFFASAGDSSLPEAWPIGYEELEPYYEQAEALYRVRGTQDPLSPSNKPIAEPLRPTDKELAISEALTRSGLHPYRIHYAQDRKPECTGCTAMLCPGECRNDAGRICLRPALEQHAASILPECRVVRLEEEGRSVRRAICDWNGRRIAVRGRIFVLAANAIFTPALLERSANERFPEGLANSSGLVGRNLMLHVSDFLLVRLKRASPALASDMNHGLSLNDFYVHDGSKLGNVHVHPVPVARETIAAFLRMHKKWINQLPAPAVSAIASIGSYLHRSSTVFTTVLEDLPYVGNRVRARPGSDDSVQYEYRYPNELRERSLGLFRAFTAAVRNHLHVRPLRPIGMLNGAHASGTCRFGADPATSVLDRDNRAHDLDNLYVADGSFFPSSGGMNPSLTIAANSLRVAEKITQRL
jgi:choline dehydrogenase-like flavoprotein